MKRISKILAGLSIGAFLALGGAALSGVSSEVKAADTKIDFTLSSADAVTKNGVTVTFAMGGGTTAPTWYDPGLRLYAGNTVTVSYNSEISKIEFNWEKQGNKDFASATADVESYTHPTAAGIGTWTGSNDTVVFTIGKGQLQLNTFSVYVPCEGGGTTEGGGSTEGGGTETGGGGTETGGQTTTGDSLFTKVTSVDSLQSGDKVVMAYVDKSTYKVNGTFESKYLKSVDASMDGDKLSVNSETAGIITLGISSGLYTLKIGSKYIVPDKADIKMDSTAIGWDISFDEENAIISQPDTNPVNKFQYNISSPRFKPYDSTTMASISLYKKAGDAAQVILESNEVNGNIIDGESNTVQVKVKEVKGVTASSYAWEIVDGSEFVSIASGADTDVLTLNLNAKGVAHVKVTVNGEVSAQATVNVTKYEYNAIEGNSYFISSIDGKGTLGADLSNVTNPDFTKDDDAFTFEKAYKGDNSYYIKKGSDYVVYAKDQNLSSKNSAIALYNKPTSCYIVNKVEEGKYSVGTTINNGETRYFAQNTEDNVWYLFEGEHYVNLLEQGEMVFAHYEVVSGPNLAYLYLGDDFSKESKRTGLKVMAYFTNGYKADITNDVEWGLLQADGTVSGTYTYGGEEHDITVEGIKVYCPVAGSLVVEGVKEVYLEGEEVKPTSVKATYSNGQSETTKTLAKDQYVVSPAVVTMETTSVKVSLKLDSSVYQTFEIEVKENIWVPAAVLGAGDEILITADGYEGVMSEGTQYDKLAAQKFDYAPTGAAVFTLESAGSANSFYLKGETGKYLNTGVDKILSYGKTDVLNFYDDKFDEFPFKIPGDDKLYKSYYSLEKNVDEFGTVSYDGISYLGTETSGYSAYAQLSLVVMNENEAWLSIEGYYSNGTEINEIVVYQIYQQANPFSVYDVTDSSEGSKTAFTFTYNEAVSEEETPWWDVLTEDSGYVSIDQSHTKFTTENSSSELNLMIYRNKDIEIKAEVTSLKVEQTFEGDLKVKVGETFDPSLIIVTATYDNGTHSKVVYPGYEFEGLDTSTVGEKTVTVKYGGKTATFKLIVTGSVESILITNKEGQLEQTVVGSSYQLKTNANPAENEPLKWSSSNPEIISVDQNGIITALKGGTATITVTDYYEIVSASVTITVNVKATGVELSQKSSTIYVGENVTLSATLSPEGANSKLTWKSNDENVAIVNDGVVTGMGEGTATITVTTSTGFSDTCIVTVNAVKVDKVTLNKTSATLEKGQTLQLNATVEPTNATNKNVTFSSSNTAVVTVTSSGKVTAKDVGTAIITVKTVDGEFTASCVITVTKPASSEETGGGETGGGGQSQGGNTEGGGNTSGGSSSQSSSKGLFGCFGSITASCAIISLASLAGAGLLLFKKRK